MQTVLDYLKQNQVRFLAEFCDYLRFPSVSAQPPHKQDLQACAAWLVAHCQQIGMEAKLCETAGHPIVVAKTPAAAARGSAKSAKPHFVVYGHYDVQPPEPLELWQSPPFEPRIKGRIIYARGSTDNKGQNFAHLKAVEAYLKTGTPLPCDLTFVLEGEEEVGSESLSGFLKGHRRELDCKAVVISDTGMPGLNHPALTYALRGIMAFEITIRGPARDLHSGVFGGAVENPAMALARLLARVRDDQGRVTIPGFYDDVAPLSKLERQQAARYPLKDAQLKKLLGAPRLFGERGFTPTEQRSARPTFEINGLTSGYQGEGSKTIVPSWARAKITCRLVPNQKPDRIRKLIVAYLKKICPPTVRLEITAGHGAEAYHVSPTEPMAQASLRALKEAFNAEPILIREGGSIPIVNEFKKILGADSLLLGLGLPDDNAHSPNEKFHLDCFEKGQRMSAFLWQELAR
ncbi:MAG: dipeptidase [Verrucomicrobiota bacterium]|jgi:acetylornithine deacetylase/succinyl-diaminopimelate desuccinylase-like protein